MLAVRRWVSARVGYEIVRVTRQGDLPQDGGLEALSGRLGRGGDFAPWNSSLMARSQPKVHEVQPTRNASLAYFTHWIRRLFGTSRCRVTALYTGERHDRLFKNAEVIWGIRGDRCAP